MALTRSHSNVKKKVAIRPPVKTAAKPHNSRLDGRTKLGNAAKPSTQRSAGKAPAHKILEAKPAPSKKAVKPSPFAGGKKKIEQGSLATQKPMSRGAALQKNKTLSRDQGRKASAKPIVRANAPASKKPLQQQTQSVKPFAGTKPKSAPTTRVQPKKSLPIQKNKKEKMLSPEPKLHVAHPLRAVPREALRVRAQRHTPIIFTLEDVHRVLEERKKDPQKTITDASHGIKAVIFPIKKRPSAAKGAPVKDEEKPTAGKKRILGAASLADILGFNPQAKKEKAAEAPVDATRVPKKFMRHFKALMELRKHFVEGVQFHSHETLRRSSKDDTGDLSRYGQHMADAASDSFDREFALGLLSGEQDAIFEIDEAINRIVAGSYGVCEITGDPISEERLIAVPFTRFSIKGQQEYERTHRRVHRQNGGIFAEMTPDEAGAYAEADSDDS